MNFRVVRLATQKSQIIQYVIQIDKKNQMRGTKIFESWVPGNYTKILVLKQAS